MFAWDKQLELMFSFIRNFTSHRSLKTKLILYKNMYIQGIHRILH